MHSSRTHSSYPAPKKVGTNTSEMTISPSIMGIAASMTQRYSL